MKNSILYTSLNNMLQTSPINKNYSLISNDNIVFLDFILKNYYSNSYSYFWHNYLNILTAKIMQVNTYINMNIHDNVIMYKSLKLLHYGLHYV